MRLVFLTMKEQKEWGKYQIILSFSSPWLSVTKWNQCPMLPHLSLSLDYGI